MPTNRRRIARTIRRRIPVVITEKYLRQLKFKDFSGTLTDEEIPIAKAHGIYKYDGHKKSQRILMRANNAD